MIKNAMQDSIEQYMQKVGQQARDASRVLTSASTSLKIMHSLLLYCFGKQPKAILAANQIDMEKAVATSSTAPYLIVLSLRPHVLKGCCKV